MLRTFVGLLMIMLVSGHTMTWLPQSFMVPEAIFEWAGEMYKMIDEYQKTTHTGINTLMLKNVKRSSNQLYALSNHVKIDCNRLLASSYAKIAPEGLQIPEFDICKNIHKVDEFFEQSRKYGLAVTYSEETLQNFGHRVLWGDINLPDTLEDIRESLVADQYSSGLLRLLYQHSMLNLQFDCDTRISVQQEIYYMYLLLILTEIKGFLTLQQIYLTKRLAPGAEHNYVAELDYAKRNFETRVKEYHTTFVQNIDSFPQHIRQCDVKDPKRGENVIELQNFSRIKLINSALVKNWNCFNCPSDSDLVVLSIFTHSIIYNCTNLGYSITSCPAEPDSHREYLWLKNNYGIYYGKNTTCDRTEVFPSGVLGIRTLERQSSTSKDCISCGCSTDQNLTKNVDETTIWRISVTDQIADMSNNMIVTGVKFVTYDNALHLQIEQSNFSHSGLLDHEATWKELHIDYSNNDVEKTNITMSYEPLRYNRKTLYLDDIKVPQDTVVTGVRFQREGDYAFKLQIRATPFNFGTGELSSINGTWIDASTNPMRPQDYEHKRVEINLNNSDDPGKCTQFDYDLTSNKFVMFTHTDILKDAGQTTIPLLHAQPVTTEPPFPLGGIGLSFRGKNGFGGYIAPRIYTADFSKYMVSSQDITKTAEETISQ